VLSGNLIINSYAARHEPRVKHDDVIADRSEDSMKYLIALAWFVSLPLTALAQEEIVTQMEENKAPVMRSYNEDDVKQEILKLGESVVRALNEADTETLLRDFWKSDSTLFLIDGIKIEGYEAIRSALEGIPTRRKDLVLDVDNEQVIILSENIALHVVQFHEKVIHMDDSISRGQGVWSTLYKKIQDDWKIIMVHESHIRNGDN
jgi:ketosteroid isomerase-like protein